MHRPTLAALVLVAALCGCSDDDSSDETTTTDVSVSTPLTPTTEAVGAADPTQPPTTTAAPTTTSTSTTSTTSTTAPPPTVEEQIEVAYRVVYDGYWACLRAPLNCDVSWIIPESESAMAMQDTMQALFDRGRYIGEEDTGYFVVESITVGDDGTTAEIVTCWWSTAVLYGPPVDPSRPVGPDNPATLANNTHGSGRQLDRLSLVDARWLLEGTDAVGEESETNLCPPEP